MLLIVYIFIILHICCNIFTNSFTILKLLGIKELNTRDKDALLDWCFARDLDEAESNLPSQTSHVNHKAANKHRNLLLNFDKIKEVILEGSDSSFVSCDVDEFLEVDYESLEAKYANIWKNYLPFLNRNFDEFISFSHLGMVLKYLKASSTVIVQRDKPPYLEYNIPNLIICAQDEIIKRTVNIYSLSVNQQLPTNDEVFYCTSLTTYEEIELFWKRCLFQQNDVAEQRIYSLINVQDLLYDQAVKAQVLFEKYFSEREQNMNRDAYKKFILCIFCSSEKEDKSIFVTAFNRYRKNVPLDRNINTHLLDYLRNNFSFNKNQVKTYKISNFQYFSFSTF